MTKIKYDEIISTNEQTKNVQTQQDCSEWEHSACKHTNKCDRRRKKNHSPVILYLQSNRYFVKCNAYYYFCISFPVHSHAVWNMHLIIFAQPLEIFHHTVSSLISSSVHFPQRQVANKILLVGLVVYWMRCVKWISHCRNRTAWRRTANGKREWIK